jgi:hypothetical protein
MNNIGTIRSSKLSHDCIIFHIDQITGRRVGISSTTTVAVVVPTGIRDQRREGLRNTIASTSNGNIFVAPS